MACDINQLLSDACTNRFTCLPTLRDFDVVMAQLLCEIKDAIVAGGVGGGGGGEGTAQVITDLFADPNGNVTPEDPTLGAIYYQEGNHLNRWDWSVTNQNWVQWSG